MDVRPFRPSDLEACLSVFDSIGATDRASFKTFLDHCNGPYFVMEHDGSVIGCGGFEVASDVEATLVWGMVRRDLQRQGLGRFLLMYRLREIGKLGSIQQVRVEAPQEVAGFFEGQGFRVGRVAGKRVELVKKLTVCA